ncbi:MAG: T9SS type A sorting domain-containing protein [Bacteroidales bacterium]|nr:T9SS type A sorting domain-containing protein [Bacteroidales bacterium]MCF8403517.1 T9SS type A sorting domain-containing protein [Bacteroidales bacterium]
MKSLFSIIPVFVLVPLSIYSQEIQNNGFENWSNQQYYEDPDGFSTTNVLTFFAGGMANVVKSTDAHSGSFALKLETVDSPEGPLAGAAFIGEPANGGFAGGIPYNQRPDSLNFYAKYNVPPTDTAYVAVLFKKFGAPLGICFAQLTGNQSTYQKYSLPISWLLPIISPDTMATAIISSTLFSMPLIGSTITVDDVSLIGASIPYPNGGFENWTAFASEEPNDWTTSNIFTLPASDISVTKTTDSYEGNFAIRIENKLTMWDDTVGFITNGTIGDEGPTGGLPVNNIPAMLSGYYKYFPVGQDSALAGMVLYHYNESTGVKETLDSAYTTLSVAAEYTYFQIPVDYFTLPEPDTLNIAFGSGNFEGSFVGLGSVLYVDALEISYKPDLTGTQEIAAENPMFYPNPFKDRFSMDLNGLINQAATVSILNSNGQEVYHKYCTSSSHHVNLEFSHYPSGIYFYKLSYGDKITTGKIIKN